MKTPESVGKRSVEQTIVELAERITILYANLSGRESANRAAFREEVTKYLRTARSFLPKDS